MGIKYIIVLLFISLLFIGQASAESITSNNFTVTWYDCNFDLTQSSCKVDIQNLATSNRDFNLSVFINSTNYNLNTYTTAATMKEWKILPTEEPVYETLLINQTCYTFDNSTNTSIPYDCSYNQTIQNDTKLMNLSQWKPTKSNMLKESLRQKMYYGTINIPKYNSKAKLDELNNTETINGTKTFMIEWTTPIIKTDVGWGSSGLIAFIDEISGDIYHPWWNATWGYKKPILINNTGNATVLTDYQVKLNVTYDSDMQADFDDIRVVNDTSGAAVPYWIESKVNSSYANIWFNASSIPASVWTNSTYYLYYGNAAVSDGGSGNNTFIQWHGAATAGFNDTAIIPASSFIYQAKGRKLLATFDVAWGLTNSVWSSFWTDDATAINPYNPNNRVMQWNDGAGTPYVSTADYVTNQWYQLKIVYSGSGNVRYYRDDIAIDNGGIGTNIPNENMGLFMYQVGAGQVEQNYSFIRKYIANEPTATLGTAQHQRRVPRFL